MENINEYAKWTDETAKYPEKRGLEYTLFGLFGETGELANKYKKIIRDDNGIITREKYLSMISELGDVAWYFVRVCKELGIEPSEVIDKNIEKLTKRKKENKISGSGDNR